MDDIQTKIENIKSIAIAEARILLQKLINENRHLKNLNAMRTDLISLNAHQLRTSLSAIKWFMKMFIDGDFGKINTEQKEVLEKSFKVNEHGIKLVTEMLRANKMDQPDMSYKFEEIDLKKFIETIMFEFSAEAKRVNIDLYYENKNEVLPNIFADEEKIRIVLQNLLENAIKYNKIDGRVVVSTKQEGGKMKIFVKDTGIGVSEECKNGVFEKFYRAPNAVDGPYTGTGLGLYNSKKVVERHGGEIGFNSNEDEGSMFFFTVPIAKKS